MSKMKKFLVEHTYVTTCTAYVEGIDADDVRQKIEDPEYVFPNNHYEYIDGDCTQSSTDKTCKVLEIEESDEDD